MGRCPAPTAQLMGPRARADVASSKSPDQPAALAGAQPLRRRPRCGGHRGHRSQQCRQQLARPALIQKTASAGLRSAVQERGHVIWGESRISATSIMGTPRGARRRPAIDRCRRQAGLQREQMLMPGRRIQTRRIARVQRRQARGDIDKPAGLKGPGRFVASTHDSVCPNGSMPFVRMDMTKGARQ